MAGACKHIARNCAKGFTLIEVMTVLAIAVVATAVAAPAFTGMVAAQRIKSAGTDLYLSLQRARSEALKRNASVTVLAKPGGWQAGWQVVDAASSTVLEDHGALTDVNVSGPASVLYRSMGRLAAGSGVSIVVTSTSGASSAAQCVSVELSGQPFVQAGPTC
ncbi:GspH/FimT family pseudopilin [Noviherbaspirillum pedocola]|uniref:Type II secretion system protein H n=1 Tax=Noviherbaspirillum pedocola TaxID=2801341 RepID=A0A934W249_9BURK|nr:GspH/FimT family protein [Noviherbaspirillum pedocola]MBK4735911.1 GspH/FimT family protein [Noviherbaspirillum pedocola]